MVSGGPEAMPAGGGGATPMIGGFLISPNSMISS